jgi:predicted metal-dependent hydrolase
VSVVEQVTPDRPATDWVVRRSPRARRARITVREDGRVVVVLPTRAPMAVAQELVRRHERWVRHHVAAALERQARLRQRPQLLDGRVLEVNGVPHAVVLVSSVAQRATVRRTLDADDQGIRGTLEVRARDTASGVTAVEGWLRAEARRLLVARVSALAPVVGVQPTKVTVRDQRSRWGSASRSGSLSFSWRLVLAPPYVLDAVVVHELAHLRHADHGPRFWALAKAHAPRTDEARRWLRANRDGVRAALD